MNTLTREQRNTNPHHHIDPGFVNLRKCYSVFGNQFITEYESRKKPGDEWPNSVFNDHLLVEMVLRICRDSQVRTLSEVLASPQPGMLFCSTEKLAGTEDVYTAERVHNAVQFDYEEPRNIYLSFGTRHIRNDTGRLEQSARSVVSVIGEIRHATSEHVVIYPLIMGAPTFDHPWNRNVEQTTLPDLMWYGYSWYETFPEDIDEFQQISDEEAPLPDEWMKYMKATSEDKVKTSFCTLLGDVAKKDWGGELNDHYTSSVHLSGRRTTAAFAFKGPAKFVEMTPELLGKRADQIFRLAQAPAELLIIQHCHLIGEAVRATLRAFAVAPHNPRRYCLIDGKDTYRLFKAYGFT